MAQAKSSKYNAEKHLPIIYEGILQNKTQRAISALCGITDDTFVNWKKGKSDVLDTILKAEADRADYLKNLSKKTFTERLEGFEVEEKIVDSVVDADGNVRIKGIKTTTKRILPSDALLMFAICNADPENFSNRHYLEHGGSVNNPIIGNDQPMTDEQIQKLREFKESLKK
jgi:hypothetical protein